MSGMQTKKAVQNCIPTFFVAVNVLGMERYGKDLSSLLRDECFWECFWECT